ncbi:MAG: FtsX-like permease family protein [Deltaproteobacteria bacterium]|nr:MAG: FtsX-like permease family protein [Deltaproteobacteria bacterium]
MRLPEVSVAVRNMARRPSLAASVLLTLGVGIGASTTIFGFVDGILLRPLGLPSSDRLVSIQELHGKTPVGRVTYATLHDLGSHRFQHLSAVAGMRLWNFALEADGQPEQVTGAMVSGDFFAAAASAPEAGAFFGPGDASEPVVVLGHEIWARRFEASQDVVGRTIHLGDRLYRIVGVARAEVQKLAAADLWIPLQFEAPLGSNRRSHLLDVVGRRRPQSSLSQARDELAAFARSLPGDDSPDLSLVAHDLQETLVAPVRPMLAVLVAAVAMLLALVTLNLTNLLLARAMSREREMAIRRALGASEGDVSVAFLVEGFLLGACGTALGIVVATWGISGVKGLLPATFPRLAEVGLSPLTVAIGVAGGLGASAISALYPALRRLGTGSIDLVQRDLSRFPARHRGREMVAAAQIMLAMVLLAGAALCLRSFLKLEQVDPGFRRRGVVGIDLPLGDRHGDDPARQAPLLAAMLESIRTVPGVTSAGLVNGLPLTGGPSTGVGIDARPGIDVNAGIRIADAGYFEALGIPLRDGRTFGSSDGPSAPRVVMVSEAFARAAWPGKAALGQRVTMKDWGDPLGGVVVGVVGDVRPANLAAPPEPTVYWHFLQFPSSFNTAVVRTDLPLPALVRAVQAEVWKIDPGQPLARVRTLEAVLADSIAKERLVTILFAAFGIAAILLAAIGLYGVLANLVGERTREIAIRGALGASPLAAMRLVLFRAGRLTLAGVAAGCAAALAAGQGMAAVLYEVQPRDPAMLTAAAVGVGAVAALASYWPARRAASVDPMTVLREE